jgi:hypothetical protein
MEVCRAAYNQVMLPACLGWSTFYSLDPLLPRCSPLAFRGCCLHALAAPRRPTAAARAAAGPPASETAAAALHCCYEARRPWRCCSCGGAREARPQPRRCGQARPSSIAHWCCCCRRPAAPAIGGLDTIWSTAGLLREPAVGLPKWSPMCSSAAAAGSLLHRCQRCLQGCRRQCRRLKQMPRSAAVSECDQRCA